ncbi:MAG TPA: hypothetical protein ENG03_00660 [Thioploca sp.]|nr:MAG: hypothetical protein B6247_00950 [Beggiatoa sp. 4572_84]RKZ62236.1 MAG: hypothetical protein DRR08_06520 [Gammaproteobacteria bacterium]HDN25613.1 hypothetical protein [Thioploca sp.]
MLENPFFLTKKANHLKHPYVTLKIIFKIFLDNVQLISIVINIFGATIRAGGQARAGTIFGIWKVLAARLSTLRTICVHSQNFSRAKYK